MKSHTQHLELKKQRLPVRDLIICQFHFYCTSQNPTSILVWCEVYIGLHVFFSSFTDIWAYPYSYILYLFLTVHVLTHFAHAVILEMAQDWVPQQVSSFAHCKKQLLPCFLLQDTPLPSFSSVLFFPLWCLPHIPQKTPHHHHHSGEISSFGGLPPIPLDCNYKQIP